MNRSTLSRALGEAAALNGAYLGWYREVARRTLSKALSGLALAAAEQRRELGEELRSLIEELGPEASALEVELEAAPPLPTEGGEEGLLAAMRELEEAEARRYASLAARAATLSGELEQLIASFSHQARRRAELAADLADLRALS